MRHELWGAMLLLAAVTGGGEAQEPRRWSPSCTREPWLSDSALAFRYAPILSYALGERYFPTIPFFTAFDGVDNNSNGLRDFTDIEEVNPSVQDGHLSWEALDTFYLRRSEQLSNAAYLDQHALLYRVRTLTHGQERELRRFLLSDEQAWRRFRRVADEELWKSFHFRVIEYYRYYIRDEGLEGHPEDIEFVFVFVPFTEDTTSGQMAEAEGRVAQATSLYEVRLGDAELTEADLQAAVVQQGQLDRGVGRQGLLENLRDTAASSIRFLFRALRRDCLSGALLGQVRDLAHAAIR